MTNVNDSPFRAGFGKTPPMLAGRDSILDDFAAALAEDWAAAASVTP